MRRITGWVAITGLAVVVSACGAMNPTAVAVTGSSDGEGMGASSGRNFAQIEPCSRLTLKKVAAEADWVTVEAEWVTGETKAFKGTCPAPEFSVTPKANMFTPRYNPNQLTISAPPGVYTIMAQTANTKAVTLDVGIK